MKQKTKIKIQSRVHVFRAEYRMTQQDLADAIGVTRATITAIEGADYNPSLELAFRIARYFKTNIETIFTIEGEKHVTVS
jgi:putative transcriptional regulator